MFLPESKSTSVVGPNSTPLDRWTLTLGKVSVVVAFKHTILTVKLNKPMFS